MKKVLLLIFGICLLTTGCFSMNTKEEEKKDTSPKIVKISYADLNKIVNNYSDYVNVDVVDIRDKEEYEEKHIIGSINIPYENLDEIIISTDRRIIVYGDTASKSKQAAKELIEMGYENVEYIAGLNDWPYELEEYE